jgi:hypothetical protein
MRNSLTSAIILAALIAASPAMPAPKTTSGVITAYECGDNCYLTIKTKAGKTITALCAAAGCRAWNEQAAMPKKLIGRSVNVTIGTGQQFDGSGNPMGDFPAFTKVVMGKT